MDRDPPDTAAELRDSERWPYNDLQSLAAQNGYGPIVGEEREDLIEHCIGALSLDSEPAAENEPDNGSDAQEPEEQEAHEPDPDPEPIEEPEQKTDGGTQTAPTTDEISVGHEGSEKLTPAGAPDDDGTAVEPPEELDLDGFDSDDLDPDSGPEPETEPDTTESQSESDDDGGILSRLKGDGKSSEEIVEEPDDPDKRERRRELRDELSQKMDGPEQTGPDTQQASGMVVDETVVGHLIEMPFNGAAAATGWDGWELSQREREANAQLFIAMCDERGIDVSETTMFALSMAGTFSGRAIQYKRHRDGGSGGEPASAPEPDADPEPAPAPTPSSSETQSEDSQTDDFDFGDSSTW